jgi:hypothetical protein
MTAFASTVVDLPDDSEAVSDYLYERGFPTVCRSSFRPGSG